MSGSYPSALFPNRPLWQRPWLLAASSLVLGIGGNIIWGFALAAIILGHIARHLTSPVPATQERGLATSGLIVGYLGLAVFVLHVLVLVPLQQWERADIRAKFKEINVQLATALRDPATTNATSAHGP